MGRILMKGNEALALAALRGGCSHFFGYPITPQNEIPEYLARELPKRGGTFLQAESELAAIHMVYGAAAAGARVMTSSSSPGIALMQEGLSMLAAAELPCVIVNVQRAGPGIGGIQPSQADYFQMTRGGGNGDYRVLSYAPASVQESTEMMQGAFDLAERYRSPVCIVSDGMLGQMMEPVEFKKTSTQRRKRKGWLVSGHGGTRKANTVKTLALIPEECEAKNRALQEKYALIERLEPRCECVGMEEAEILIIAYGSTSRIVRSALEMLAADGVRAGLIRPQTLWPFPQAPLAIIPATCQAILVVEMSCGQMIDDVRLVAKGRLPVAFFGRSGGVIPTPVEIAEAAKEALGRA